MVNDGAVVGVMFFEWPVNSDWTYFSMSDATTLPEVPRSQVSK
jgi:hypothetical protein